MLTLTSRRTLAPRGQTPILKSWDRHDRISAISAVTVSPKRRRLVLYFHLLPVDANSHGDLEKSQWPIHWLLTRTSDPPALESLPPNDPHACVHHRVVRDGDEHRPATAGRAESFINPDENLGPQANRS